MNHVMLPAKMPLNEVSWQGIQAVAHAGKASEYWKPGDTKTITLNGDIVGTKFDNAKIDVFILGIDHNADLEGKNHIHFGIGMKDGSLTGLCDSRYGKVCCVGMKGFCMNQAENNSILDINAGGWERSYMRARVLGANKLPTSPTEGTLLAALPRALREVMVPTTKYTLNVVDGNVYSSESVTPTRDSLWLLSMTEIYGDYPVGIAGPEIKKQMQYDYFKTRQGSDDRKIMAYNAALPKSVTAFSRSISLAKSGCFCTTGYFGGAYYELAYVSSAILACFAV